MSNQNCDVLVVGAGMVGLCVANQLLERDIASKIIVLDKELIIGTHTSGRNSGVLHAGVYYKPNSIKAKVCVNGAKRLRAWIEARNLPLNPCGKVIVPPRAELDPQLDLLADRARANGAIVEYWDEKQLKQLIPEARSASGRALWSPNTAVVRPKVVLQQLQSELENKGVNFQLNEKDWLVDPCKNQIKLANGDTISYAHLFNCAGLQADRVAYHFGVGHEYMLLPFKGLYWQLKPNCPIQPKTNLYPVPDLNVPFLGVHFTPSADQTPVVSIGPTATPASCWAFAPTRSSSASNTTRQANSSHAGSCWTARGTGFGTATTTRACRGRRSATTAVKNTAPTAPTTRTASPPSRAHSSTAPASVPGRSSARKAS